MPDSFVHTHVHTEFCLAPHTRVVTAALEWKQIRDVNIGEEIVGFGENLKGNKSRMSRAVVEAKKWVKRPCYAIYLEDGSKIIASDKHGWVTLGTKGSQLYPGGPVQSVSNSRKWVITENLEPGKTSIVKWATPWGKVDPLLAKEAGWLAGVLDGEGWLSGGQVNFAQNSGPVLDEMYRVCHLLGYEVSKEYKQSPSHDCRTFWLAGYETALRFMSQCDPVRFRNRHDEIWVGRKAGGKLTKPVKVSAVQYIGERDTIALQTSTKTLVAEGFLSHNSMLDGATKIDELVEKVAEDGMPACACTDHGNMYGIVDFYKACEKHGVRPIVGTELYQAYEHRSERIARKKGGEDDTGGEDEKGRKNYYHITCLAENNTGYKNLVQLSSRSYLEGFYMKPRVDWELLEAHHEGLIVTSGCLGGQVLQHLLRHEDKEALAKAAIFQDIFGRDSFFIELQDHGIQAQKETNPKLLKIAKKLNAPILATNDSHYTHREDHDAHDSLLCIQTGSVIAQEDRFKFEGNEHYVKSAAEMRSVFSELPEACDNSLWIGERCSLDLDFSGKPILPVFEVPEQYESDVHYLKTLTLNGAKKRWGDPIPEAYAERLAYELKVIEDMGFASYFLIVWDIYRYSRERKIRAGVGRGSAAGSAVAYCLHITDLDPIEHDLLFERMLNPSRVSMPDIDMDFDSRYREEMINYAREKYGKNHVSQIITYSTIKARAAVRDAAKVLGLEWGIGDQISKAMPPLIAGRNTPLHACLELDEKYKEGYDAAIEVRNLYELGGDYKRVIDVAIGLEDLRRQHGIHAAAVVIAKDPLIEYLPLQKTPLKGGGMGPLVTQYDMHGVEDLGLLKMDFLGVTFLDIVDETERLIKLNHGIDVQIDPPPMDDEKTLELLQAGDTVGVFQLESAPMRQLLRSLKPTSFGDVCAVIALYRPGPMAGNMHNDYADRKNDRKPVEYLHEDSKESLGDTYGLMIYQEQMMRISQKFAGYSLAEADNLRKACGKKIRKVMESEREKFVQGAIDTGYGAEVGTMWFDLIEPFADYSFNKSHAYAYGMLSWQTAYLKAHYPVEYMAAFLSFTDKAEKKALALYECSQMGLNVQVPDINLAYEQFVPRMIDGEWVIPFGLAHVMNVGTGAAEKIVEARGDKPFVDFFDFCDRVSLSVLNKKFVESLIKAGAFDSLGHSRHGLISINEKVMASISKRRKREEEEGQFDLFSAMEEPKRFQTQVPTSEFDKKRKLSYEKEMLGFYISDSPISELQPAINRKASHTIAQIMASFDSPIDEQVHVGGMITQYEKRYTKKGDLMASFVLEDTTSSIKVLVFAKTMKHNEHKMSEDAIVVVRGRPAYKEDHVEFFAAEIMPLDNISEHVTEIHINLPENAEKIAEIKQVIGQNAGKSTVFLHAGAKTLKLAEENSVKCGPEFLSDLELALE